MGRPIPTFHGFCGQESIVESLRTLCKGSHSQSAPLPHILLAGPSGIGKTALAKAIAKEMGTVCHDVYCSCSTRKSTLAEKLAGLNIADILFLDEVHALSVDCQEMLYPAIDYLTAPKPNETPGPKPQTAVTVTLKPFTLVVASDQCGKLRTALKRRLALQFTLADYTTPEMRVIVGNYAAEFGILLNPQATTRLAEAARGLPRKARHLMQSLKLCLDDLQAEATKADVVKFLRNFGIDDGNLNSNDRRYLAFLARRSSEVSLQNIGSALGLDLNMITQDIEGYLVKQGLIGICARGRFLTGAGRNMVMDRGFK